MKPFPLTGVANLALSLFLSPVVLADQGDLSPTPSPHHVSANISAVSNYVSRGNTQTDNHPAIQGGLEYRHDAGLYAGTWMSNVDYDQPRPRYEVDLYAGLAHSLSEALGYDVSVVYYHYPEIQDWDYAEVIGTIHYQGLKFMLAYTFYGPNQGGLFDRGDIYYGGNYEYADLPFGMGMKFRLGYYDFHNLGGEGLPSADYWHYGASLTKKVGDLGSLSLNWDQNNGNPDSVAGYDNNPMFWVGWLKEF
jgi:uncharacterized protein (TIGR02001 family)